MIIILTVLLISIVLIILILNYIKCNNEKFIDKSKHFNIKHFITNLNLYLPKNNKWNDDLISRWKRHEYKTNKEILNILNKIDDKSIIIEAGGHIGDTTFFMSTYLNNIGKKCLIYVFEPDISKCNYIQDIININKITNIKIFNVGISNKFLNGLLDKKAHAGAWTIKDGNDFKIIPLDSINYKYTISFIKLDVEGFEYNALLGAKKIINMFNPILCIERENKEIKEFLNNFKYNLYLKTDLDFFYSIIKIPKIINKIYISHDENLPNFPLEPHELQKAHNTWENKNKNYKLQYWDTKKCKEYFIKNFSKEHLDTFNCINAYAGKCNFFRYCIIYNEGGWYSDWKQECLQDNLLDNLSNNNEDIILFKDEQKDCIMNAFFGSVKKHPLFLQAINNCIFNVKNKIYTNNVFDTTGVCLLGKSFRELNLPNKLFKGQYDFKNNIFKMNDNTKIIIHKCTLCGINSNWKNGNNYNVLFKNKTYYCN